jgi:hypothetical protein
MDPRVQGTQFCDREGSRSRSPSSSTQTGPHANQIVLDWEPNACAIQHTQQHVIRVVATDSRDEHPEAPKSASCPTRLVLQTCCSCLCIRATGAGYRSSRAFIGPVGACYSTSYPLRQGTETAE